MDQPTREQVWQALYGRLATLAPAPFTTVSRRITMPDQVPPGDLPALMIWEQPEHTNQAGAAPMNRVWTALAVVVFINPDKAIAGATILNPLIDAVEGVMNVSDDFAADRNTLGGLVAYARIEGETLKETGDIDPDGRGGAVIQIKIRVP